MKFAGEALLAEMDAEPGEEIEALYRSLTSDGKAGRKQQRAIVTTTDYALVGREAAWKTLQRCWRRLSQPHFVCIAGEPGIGKTRLAEELLMLAEQEGLYAARTRSHALEGRLAYGPVADWLRAEPLKTGLAKLDALWLTEVARILPELLIEHPDLPHPEPIRDSWQRKRLFEALAHAFTQIQRKMVLVLDDLQWCDSDTLEWLQYLLESADNRLLVVGTVRPEEIDDDHPLHRIRQQLERLNRSTYLPLEQLAPEDVRSLAAQVAAHSLAQHLAEQVVADTAGNPLFVIESVRMMESMAGDEGDGGASELSTELTQDFASMDERIRAMPPKMVSVIQSRLALLSPAATQVMQMGATIGRAFDVALLAHATEMTTDAVLVALDELWQQRVIREVDSIHFDFSHDRLRDVAYGEIGPLRRRLLHGRVVDAIEESYFDKLETLAGELADHCRHAGMFERSLDYYQKAAASARQLYAYQDVAKYLEMAIAIAEKTPSLPQQPVKVLDLCHELGVALLRIHGWGSKPAANAWNKAYQIAMNVGEPFRQCRALMAQDVHHRNRGEWREARKFSELGLDILSAVDDPCLRTHFLSGYGGVVYHMGEPLLALEYFDKALEYNDNEVRQSFEWFSSHPKINNLSRSSKAFCLAGYADQARHRDAEALKQIEIDRDLEQYFPILDFSGMLYSFLRDTEAVEKLGIRLIEMSTKQHYGFYLDVGHIFVSWARAHKQEDAQPYVQIVRERVDDHRRRGIRMFEPYWRGMFAETLACADEIEEALKEAQQAYEFGNYSGNIFWNSQLLKLKGDCQQQLGEPHEIVEATYQQAVDTAHQQGSKLLELRATVSLCRLWQKQGKSKEAHQLLAPIYGWFTEGFDTVDLKEAKALLEELAMEIG